MSNHVGSRLKHARESAGLTLEEVGLHLGVKKQTIHKYETGVIDNIPLDKIAILGELYHVDPAYLAGINDKDTYYIDSKTREIAENIANNTHLRMMFDAARDVSPESLKTVYEMIKLLRDKEHDIT